MFDRTERGVLARWWWTIDRPLLGVFGRSGSWHFPV